MSGAPDTVALTSSIGAVNKPASCIFGRIARALGPPSSPLARQAEHIFTYSVVVGATCYAVYYTVSNREALLKSVVGGALQAVRAVGGGAALDSAVSSALQPLAEELCAIGPGLNLRVIPVNKDKDNISAVGRFVRSRLAEDEEASGLLRGSAFAGIYHELQSDLVSMQCELMQACVNSNLLYPTVFKAARQMEADTVAMMVNMLRGATGATTMESAALHAPEACGLLTTGGTESILLAMKAYRDAAYAARGAFQPEVVCCVTAHPALDKAADYLGFTLIKLKACPKSQQLRPDDVSEAITRNTIAIYASAPTFPHGVVDPISDLAAIAKERGIGLHVDNCLGGILLSFAYAAGVEGIPLFDFRLPGVTSISCDLHKYGQTPKGASIVAFRTPQLRRHVYTTVSDWPGGLYATPTASGSRSAAAGTVAWATLRAIGVDGYTRIAKETCELHRRVRTAVADMPGLQLVGSCTASIVAMTTVPHAKFSIYALAARMEAKGWHLGSLQSPPAIHVCITERFGPVIDAWLRDLRSCCEEAMLNPSDPAYEGKGSAGIYGASAVLPEGEMHNILRHYCDILYAVPSEGGGK